MFGRAIALFEQALADCVRVLGEDHPSTLISRNNLADAYREAGDLGRAIARCSSRPSPTGGGSWARTTPTR